MNRHQTREKQPLPVDVLVGQLFLVQPDPQRAAREALREHEENYYGSFMVRRDNLESLSQGRTLTRAMRSYWRRLPPPLVGMDEEGGLVSDTAHLMSSAPSPEALGRVDDIEVTQDVYESMGRKLRALGINTVFAPVLDVNTQSQNPVIGTRSFGSNTELVSRHSMAALRGLRAARLAACVKHFPGHGDTKEDSHSVLPVVKADRDVLMNRELAPFIEAIGSSDPPEMVMTAHVAYPALGDKKRPATWSKPILRDLLRGELRFNGVVISDAMEMAAVTSLSPEMAAYEAILAGVDLLLYAYDRDMAGKAYHGLVEAVKSGRLPRDRVEESVERIFALRDRLSQEPWIEDDEAYERLGILEDQPFYEAALDSLALEGNLGALGELTRSSGRKTLIIPQEAGGRTIPLDIVREQLEPEGFQVETVSAEPDKARVDSLLNSLDKEGALVVATASRGSMNSATRHMVERLSSRDMIKIGVALLDPGDTEAMMGTNCRIKTFGVSQPQLWALCQKLIP